MDAQDHEISQLLASLAATRAGSFAARASVSGDALQLRVEKVGPIELPIDPATAGRLIAVARKSPFGLGEQTLHDDTVRDGWEVAKSRIKIDGRRWNPVLREQLASLHEQLGLPAGTHLEPSLDKLTIYGPGQFFKMHQDTERSDDMVASLVVLLPSKFHGGALRVESDAERSEFRRTAASDQDLQLIAFYTDCHHEIRPVRSGFRLALIYQLRLIGAPERPASASLGPNVDVASAVAGALHRHFEPPSAAAAPEGAPAPPAEKLVYLLDHQYTPSALAWHRLKGPDIQTAAALSAAAEQADCVVHLCLAEVRQVWQCESDFHGSPYSRRGYGARHDWASEPPNEDDKGESYNPIDLVDDEVCLSNWLDRDGKKITLASPPVSHDELACSVATDSLVPEGLRYEGYMGNYGETLERWYHRGAIVLWPRSREIVMEARKSPAKVARQLGRQLARSGTQRAEAIDTWAHLAPYWPEVVRTNKSEALLEHALIIARELGDPEVAIAVLGPLWAPEPDAKPRSHAAAGDLLRDLGRPWFEQLLEHWMGPPERPVFEARRWRRPWWRWHNLAPGFLLALRAGSKQSGPSLVGEIVEQQLAEFEKDHRYATPARLASPFDFDASAETELSQRAARLLAGVAIAGKRKLRKDALDYFTGDDTPLSPTALVRTAELSLAHGVLLDLSLPCSELLEAGEKRLEAELSRPLRRKGDWRMDVPVPCKCEDCGSLRAYLRSGERSAELPLNKGRRMHLHHVIDGACLPVSHETRRSGSPFTLVLTKLERLHELEGKRRAHAEQAMASLQRLRKKLAGAAAPS